MTLRIREEEPVLPHHLQGAICKRSSGVARWESGRTQGRDGHGLLGNWRFCPTSHQRHRGVNRRGPGGGGSSIGFVGHSLRSHIRLYEYMRYVARSERLQVQVIG